MGMDVHGQRPKDAPARPRRENFSTDERFWEAVFAWDKLPGVFFRASIWSWPVVMSVVAEANEKSHLGLDLRDWYSNDGAGLPAQDWCDALADAMQLVLDEIPDDGVVELQDPRGISELGNAVLTALGSAPVTRYRVDKEFVQVFIDFLRACGGFTID